MPNPYRLTFHQWACDHGLSILTAMSCHEALCAAEVMQEGSQALRPRKLQGMLPGRPSRDERLKMYRDHERVFRVLTDIEPITEGRGDQVEHAVLDVRDC